MNEENLNMEVRKFLKKVGVNSQREIENAILEAIKSGRLEGNEMLEIKMTMDVPSINLSYKIEGQLALE